MKQNNNRKITLLALVFLLISAIVYGQEINLPTSEPAEDEFRFAAIGDTGTGGKNQLKVARKLLEMQTKTKFNLLLFLGDNLYENGSPKGVEKKFLKPYAPLYRRGVEFRGAIGNHDRLSENGILLQQMLFQMGTNTYYSFSKKDNLVEFFAIDSTLTANLKNLEVNELQLKWLENNLSKSKAIWKIAFMHHPLYSSAKKHGVGASDQEEMLRIRKTLEPLFKKHGVKISVNGHDHIYERTKLQKGVQYFTSGAGAKLRKGNLQTDSPYYAFGNDKVRSFMLFSVKKDSINFWAIGVNGNILDSGSISNNKQ